MIKLFNFLSRSVSRLGYFTPLFSCVTMVLIEAYVIQRAIGRTSTAEGEVGRTFHGATQKI